jgi:chromosome segregation ATPase
MGAPLQTLTSYPSQVTINSQLTAANVKGKSMIIMKGLQQRGQVISDKNENVSKLMEEKRQYQLVVT